MNSVLTKAELDEIEKRIDEITEAIEMCTEYDDDVLYNLSEELDNIILTLENVNVRPQ